MLHAVHALRLGHDPAQAAADVMRGNDRLDQPGFGEYLTNTLVMADLLGRRRTRLNARAHMKTIRLSREEDDRRKKELAILLLLALLSDDEKAALFARYRVVSGRIVDGLVKPLAEDLHALRAARVAGRSALDVLPKTTAAAMESKGVFRADPHSVKAFEFTTRVIFRANGIVPQHESRLRLWLESAVTQAYERGRFTEWQKPQVKEALWGFHYTAILDSRTTNLCVTGSTRISPIGTLRKVFRRQYKGEILTVRASGGYEVEVTPNHPVLTARGWLRADELDPRFDVLHSVGSHGFCVACAKNIGVPPTFSEIADAAFQPSVSEIKVERGTTADFHGDGQIGDNDVHIAVIKRPLRMGIKPQFLDGLVDEDFGHIELSGRGGGCRPSNLHLLRGLPVSETAKLASCLMKNAVEPAFGMAYTMKNVGRPHSAAKEPNGFCGIANRARSSLVSRDLLHYANLDEQARHGGGCDTKLPCQRCGRLSVSIKRHDLISVAREFRSCHVYNLESSQGCYHAGGLVVKNCRKLDGMTAPVDDPVWIRWTPPNHFGCRSHLVEAWSSSALARMPEIVEPKATVDDLMRFMEIKRKFLGYL